MVKQMVYFLQEQIKSNNLQEFKNANIDKMDQ